ncbi:MAG: hypothetical protein IPH88_17980 [Bacteroidales bacterium]|nr:hypothetical protein [Bacteroidales bacterium]
MFGQVEIKFRGEKKTLKFNINARYLFCQMHTLTEDQVTEFFANPNNITAVRDMIFCAALSADSQAERKIEYNVYDIGEWMEEAGAEEVLRVINAATQANAQATGKESKADKKKA